MNSREPSYEEFSDADLLAMRREAQEEFSRSRIRLNSLLFTGLVDRFGTDDIAQAVERLPTSGPARLSLDEDTIWQALDTGGARLRLPPSLGAAIIEIVTRCSGTPGRWKASELLNRMDRAGQVLQSLAVEDNRRRVRAVESRRSAPQRPTEPPPPADAVPADLEGYDYKPDPLEAKTAEELLTLLYRLKVWAGDPPLRELSRRSGIPYSTVNAMLSGGQLPDLKRMVAFIRALGCNENDCQRWTTAWRRLRLAKSRTCSSSSGKRPRKSPKGSQLRRGDSSDDGSRLLAFTVPDSLPPPPPSFRITTN